MTDTFWWYDELAELPWWLFGEQESPLDRHFRDIEKDRFVSGDVYLNASIYSNNWVKERFEHGSRGPGKTVVQTSLFLEKYGTPDTQQAWYDLWFGTTPDPENPEFSGLKSRYCK